MSNKKGTLNGEFTATFTYNPTPAIEPPDAIQVVPNGDETLANLKRGDVVTIWLDEDFGLPYVYDGEGWLRKELTND